MLAWLSVLMLAQTTPDPLLSQNNLLAEILPPATPQEIIRNQPVRPLPGQLDAVPVLNSNSPEIVETPGILLSTFPPDNTAYPTAHLNYPFEGRFDVFAHHIARAPSPNHLTTLYLGILVHNPSDRPVTLDILQGASYSTQPEAPFSVLPDSVEFYSLPVYAGPGSRVSLDVLQQQRQEAFPAQVIIPPGQSRMIANEPIAVRTLASPINGRTLLMRLNSSGQVYVASLAQYAPMTWYGIERPPSLQDWQSLLVNGSLAGPRDRAPTPPDLANGQLIYGRVSGVSIGSRWIGTVTDPDSGQLTLPNPGESVSYGINTLTAITLGTGQIQSAPLAVRYPDTAYESHGNYGVQYSLELPLQNDSEASQRVSVYLETPLKNDETVTDQLRFLNPPPDRIFFRGTVQVRYRNGQGEDQQYFVHLVQRQGQEGDPLLTLDLPPGDRRQVFLDFIYPADSTPPQVLTVSTAVVEEPEEAGETEEAEEELEEAGEAQEAGEPEEE